MSLYAVICCHVLAILCTNRVRPKRTPLQLTWLGSRVICGWSAIEVAQVRLSLSMSRTYMFIYIMHIYILTLYYKLKSEIWLVAVSESGTSTQIYSQIIASLMRVCIIYEYRCTTNRLRKTCHRSKTKIICLWRVSLVSTSRMVLVTF